MFFQMTKSLMPGLVYASGVVLGTEKFSQGATGNMLLIAFGVVVCAIGEANLVIKGLIQQLAALGFEVGGWAGVSGRPAARGRHWDLGVAQGRQAGVGPGRVWTWVAERDT